MSSYLLNRNGNYHLRVRVPLDLSGIIPSAELVKSLKTRDCKQAHISARPYLQTIFQTFTLFRAGFITDDQARTHIDRALGRGVNARPEIIVVVTPLPLSRTLSSVISQYISDREKGWTIKTKMENEASLRLIVDIIGDVGVKSIDRDRVRNFRDILSRLPANLYKIFPALTIAQVLERMGTGGVTPMSITSVNKHLSRFSSVMAQCVKERLIEINPAEGLALKQRRKTDAERKAYSREDLTKIVQKLPRDPDHPERFWLPILAMYSGLRLDELCQLYVEDVKVVDGVLCLDVNDSHDKKLKTLSSSRLVPIHPRLVDLGFLEYVKGMQEQKHPRLWMNLERREADGYGSAYGKVFQRFNRKYITDDPQKTFHSLRHTFADTLKQRGVQESLISELMGHSNSNITTGRYGKRYRPKVLLDAIRKLE
jgi:integrase